MFIHPVAIGAIDLQQKLGDRRFHNSIQRSFPSPKHPLVDLMARKSVTVWPPRTRTEEKIGLALQTRRKNHHKENRVISTNLPLIIVSLLQRPPEVASSSRRKISGLSLQLFAACSICFQCVSVVPGAISVSVDGAHFDFPPLPQPATQAKKPSEGCIKDLKSPHFVLLH